MAPARIRISDDLPDPLTPMSPTRSPSSTTSVTSWKTVRLPKASERSATRRRDRGGASALVPVAAHPQRHGERGVAEPAHGRGDEQPIGIFQRHSIIDLLPREDGTHAGHLAHHAGALEIGDARGFEPAQVNDVVDVAEGVHVSPLHGELDGDGPPAQRAHDRSMRWMAW